MLEILPNWHPIFVHFTIGLFTISVGFYVLAYLGSYLRLSDKKIVLEFEVVARWCLWVSAFTTIFTVIAGLYDYNTVRHDALSHLAMINHRNWALVTAFFILSAAIWSSWHFYRKRRVIHLIYILALIIIETLLFITAWKGGELVYRHGLGVLSLPIVETIDRHHHKIIEHQTQPTTGSAYETKHTH